MQLPSNIIGWLQSCGGGSYGTYTCALNRCMMRYVVLNWQSLMSHVNSCVNWSMSGAKSVSVTKPFQANHTCSLAFTCPAFLSFISVICDNPFSLTLLLNVAKMSLPKRSAPYRSIPPFVIFWHSGTLALRAEHHGARMSKNYKGWVRSVWFWTLWSVTIWRH